MKDDSPMMQNYDKKFVCPFDRSDRGDEFELLLTCCRPVPLEIDFTRQQELASKNLNINKILELAHRHKIAALVYYNLRRHPVGTFDQVLMAQLEVQYKNNSQRAIKSLQAVNQIAKVNAGFPIYVMKGLDVALRAYKDLAVRHVGDMDILVASEHLGQFYEILEAQGWASNMSTYKYYLTSSILRNSHHDMCLFRASFPRLELHWRPTYNPHEIPMRYFQSSTASIQAGTRLNGFNNEDLLIYLCVHGGRHGWGRLKWLFDVPNVIEQLDLDWPIIWSRAEKLGVSFALQQALLLTQKYCNIVLSEPMRLGFKHKISKSQWFSIKQFQSGPEIWMEYPPTYLSMHILLNRILTASNPKVFIWYCTSLFNPSINDYELIKLPRQLEFLYFVLRPFTLGLRRVKMWKVRIGAT